MASAWTDNGPVSLPSRSLAYGAGVAVLLLAAAGVGMGFEAAFHRSATPDLSAEATQAGGKDDALIAKPIVELAPPTAAPAAADDGSDAADDEAAKADAIAAQTAAAQAIQAKPSTTGGNIDDVLTSPTEKPPASTKGPADGAPPPVKSDVPF